MPRLAPQAGQVWRTSLQPRQTRGTHEKTQGTPEATPHPVAQQPIVVNTSTPDEIHEQAPARKVLLVLMLR